MSEYEVHAECADGEVLRLKLKAVSMAYAALAAIAGFHAAFPKRGLVRMTVERLEKENRELKGENERLKADYKTALEHEDDLRGEYMKLPLDADGVPIRIGDVVWYVGECVDIAKDYPLNVAGFVMLLGTTGTFIETREYPDGAIEPESLTHKKPEQADSWEKLEEDANKGVCDYAGAPVDEDGMTTCDGCRFQKHEECYQGMILDVLKRAKKLAGIEEEAER